MTRFAVKDKDHVVIGEQTFDVAQFNDHGHRIFDFEDNITGYSFFGSIDGGADFALMPVCRLRAGFENLRVLMIDARLA